MATAKQIIKDAFKNIGVRFLDLDDSGATGQSIIEAAFRKIEIKSSTTPLTTEELNDGLDTLNDLLAEWNYDGIDLGVTSVTLGATTLPTWSLSALKSNLAARLASEYGETVSQSLQTQAVDGRALMVERTSPINLADGLQYLHDMILQWDAEGIRLGYLYPRDINEEVGLPNWSYSAVKFNLAKHLAPLAEKPLSQELNILADNSYDELLRRTVHEINVVYPNILPTGSGNSTCNTWYQRYFRDPTKRDILLQDGPISTNEGEIIGNSYGD